MTPRTTGGRPPFVTPPVVLSPAINRESTSSGHTESRTQPVDTDNNIQSPALNDSSNDAFSSNPVPQTPLAVRNTTARSEGIEGATVETTTAANSSSAHSQNPNNERIHNTLQLFFSGMILARLILSNHFSKTVHENKIPESQPKPTTSHTDFRHKVPEKSSLEQFTKLVTEHSFFTANFNKMTQPEIVKKVGQLKENIKEFTAALKRSNNNIDQFINSMLLKVQEIDTQYNNGTAGIKFLEALLYVMEELNPGFYPASPFNATPTLSTQDAVNYLSKECPDCRVESVDVNQLKDKLESLDKKQPEALFLLVESGDKRVHGTIVMIKNNPQAMDIAVIDSCGFEDQGVHSFGYAHGETVLVEVMKFCQKNQTMKTRIGILEPRSQDDGYNCNVWNSLTIERLHKNNACYEYLWQDTQPINSNQCSGLPLSAKNTKFPLLIMKSLPPELLELMQNPSKAEKQMQNIKDQSQLSKLQEHFKKNEISIPRKYSTSIKNRYLASQGLKLLAGKYSDLWNSRTPPT